MVCSKVSVFVDLHRHRKALKREMEALAASNHQQELLVQKLQCAQRELEHAVRMRDNFMSMVSHELRTPLNTLYLETQVRKLHLAKGNLAPFEAERLPAMIERDQRQIRSMVRLIDDMLDVTRMRSGALSIEPKPIDLSALAQRVMESLAQQAEAAGCAIGLDAEDGVDGTWDEFRIEQVLTNLLTNALRYGGGRPVQLSVRQTGDSAQISVRDQGIGIAPEDHARIFEQFERTDDSRKHAPGLGLGLFITRQIVRLHGGEIMLESRPGEGALFRVSLPLQPPPQAG
ncbi:Signal transduction histidine-protein kinase BarA [Variovorax sp. PBL-E5]|nr:Signal transduction histidine-protein kinase BarA [Variovorax sp. PBL-E5]